MVQNIQDQEGYSWSLELDILKKESISLQIKLRAAADLLEKNGLSPESELVNAISDFQVLFKKISCQIQAEFDRVGLLELPLDSLLQFDEAVDELKREWVRRQGEFLRVLAPLEEALNLFFSGGTLFQPLSDCQEKARELKMSLETCLNLQKEPEYQELATGQHAFCYLLRLVKEHDRMEPETAEEHRQKVAEVFDKSLAMAILQGRIGLHPSSAPAPTTSALSETATQAEDGSGVVTTSEPAVLEPVVEETKAAAISAELLESVEAETAIEPEPRPSIVLNATPATLPDIPIEAPAPAAAPEHEKEPCEQSGTILVKELWSHGSVQQPSTGIWASLIWILIRDDRLGLAYTLRRCLPGLEAHAGTPTPEAILALHLARSFSEDSITACENTLDKAISYFSEGSDDPGMQAAVDSLRLSALLVPALLGHSFKTDRLIGVVRNRTFAFDSLYKLFNSITELKRLPNLNAAVLRGVNGHAVWEAELARHLEECRNWHTRAEGSTIKFAAATDIWRDWLRKDQPLGSLWQIVTKDQWQDSAARAKVSEIVTQWEKERDIEDKIQKTDQKLRCRPGKRIVGRAISSLIERVKECLDLARRWQDIHSKEPHDLSEAERTQISRHRQIVISNLAEADREIGKRLGAPDIKLPEASGLKALRAELGILEMLFSPGDRNQATPPPQQTIQVFLEDILRIPGLDLDDEGGPVTHDDQTALRLLSLLTEERGSDWMEALEGQLRVGHFINGQRILDRMRRENEERLSEAEGRFNTLLAQERGKLRHYRDNMLEQLQKSMLNGLLGENEFLDASYKIAPPPEENLALTAAFAELKGVETDLDKRREEKATHLYERLASFAELPETEKVLVKEAIETGDYLTANEYLSDLDKGESPSRRFEETRRSDPGFFPEFLGDIEKAGKGKAELRQIIADLNSAEAMWGPISLRSHPDKTKVIKLMQAWEKARYQKKLEDIETLLPLLGFNSPKLEVSLRGDDTLACDLRTLTISDREICPIPYFGGSATSASLALVFAGFGSFGGFRARPRVVG